VVRSVKQQGSAEFYSADILATLIYAYIFDLHVQLPNLVKAAYLKNGMFLEIIHAPNITGWGPSGRNFEEHPTCT